jgi:SAM-dependent methyltransferase
MNESRSDHGRPAYDEQYFRETYGVDGLRRFGIHWWSVRWYADMTDWCLRRTGGRRMLEIGCGHGFALARLESRYETWGVDISAYAIGQATRFAPRSHCLVADVEQGLPAALAAGSFDVVVAKYVLEHLRDPGAALRRIAGFRRTSQGRRMVRAQGPDPLLAAGARRVARPHAPGGAHDRA